MFKNTDREKSESIGRIKAHLYYMELFELKSIEEMCLKKANNNPLYAHDKKCRDLQVENFLNNLNKKNENS